ncbi:hypothetical protein SLA2020_140410 [Shorea laevis]
MLLSLVTCFSYAYGIMFKRPLQSTPKVHLRWTFIQDFNNDILNMVLNGNHKAISNHPSLCSKSNDITNLTCEANNPLPLRVSKMTPTTSTTRIFNDKTISV